MSEIVIFLFLQEVSREFKNTLEREIGLDEVNNPVPTTPTRFPTPLDFLDDSGTNVAPKNYSPQYGKRYICSIILKFYFFLAKNEIVN